MAKELVKSLDERTSSLCTNPCLFYEETEYKHNMDKLINKEEKNEKRRKQDEHRRRTDQQRNGKRRQQDRSTCT